MKRVCVLGIDCMSPRVVFGPMRQELPTLDELLSEGHSGILESSFPPTTIPAWMSMFTGKDPGQLGVYGFKHRRGHAMNSPIEAVSRLDYQAKPIWEWASRQNLESVVVGVPSSWPVASLRGAMVSDFTTPTAQRSVYPERHLRLLGEDWNWDLSNWRMSDHEATLNDLIALSENYWRVFDELITGFPNWSLGILVDIAMDRAHHLFWEQGIDEGEAPRREGPLWNFYKYIDAKLESFTSKLPRDTSLLIVSDHGAQAMQGGFNLNQWLIDQGLLVLNQTPEGTVKPTDVNWHQSTWWGEGGYVGKLHLSPYVGEQPQRALDDLRARLAAEEFGNDVRVQAPHELYADVQGAPPTAFIVVKELRIRCIGSLASDHNLWPEDNDQGADAANHHPDGLFIQSGCTNELRGREALEAVYDWIKTELRPSDR